MEIQENAMEDANEGNWDEESGNGIDVKHYEVQTEPEFDDKVYDDEDG